MKGLTLIIFAMLFCSCSESSRETPHVESQMPVGITDEEYDQIVSRFLGSNDHANQFARTFDSSRHWIAGIRTAHPVWISEVMLHGKYVVSMRIPLQSSSSDVFAMQEQPTIQLSEIASAEMIEGRIQLKYGPLSGTIISVDEWAKVVAADGKLESVGISLQKNAPLPLFVKSYNEARRGGY